MGTFPPPKWLCRFADWSVSICTEYKPEECELKYDYWFGGLFVGWLIGLIL